jgi:hypothetical protein
MELTEYHYVYYSYEEYGRGYIGSRTCKCLPEEDIKYFGSFKDKSFKPTQKIILKSYNTREEAYEDEIILQEHYKVVENPHFANRAYQTSTKFYISKEELKRINQRQKELGIGIHSYTKEERIKNGKRLKELGAGIHGQSKEKMTENGRKGGKIGGKKSAKTRIESKIGIFGFTEEQRIENGKKGGAISGRNHKINGTGFFKLTKEQRSENSKKIASQKWMCEETGFITNAGNLTQYQRARGIDTTKRVRIS